jgi:hypothetical protein
MAKKHAGSAKKSRPGHPPPGAPSKSPDKAPVKASGKATEPLEVQGRHQNTGQKDHKGAR